MAARVEAQHTLSEGEGAGEPVLLDCDAGQENGTSISPPGDAWGRQTEAEAEAALGVGALPDAQDSVPSHTTVADAEPVKGTEGSEVVILDVVPGSQADSSVPSRPDPAVRAQVALQRGEGGEGECVEGDLRGSKSADEQYEDIQEDAAKVAEANAKRKDRLSIGIAGPGGAGHRASRRCVMRAIAPRFGA